MQETQILSLVGKLRSHMLQPKNKNLNKKEKITTIEFLFFKKGYQLILSDKLSSGFPETEPETQACM